MRRSLRFLTLFLTMSLLLSGTVLAEASSVTYVNQAERFVFLPEDGDLFQNFKGVMPGDERIQTIDVGNDSDVPVKIYLKISPVSEESEAFLRQLKLTIEAEGEILYEEMMDQQGQFSDFTELVPLEPDETMGMRLTLEVPLSLSNDYMNQEALVEWIFKVEEPGGLPDTEGPPGTDPPPDKEPPKLPETGSAGVHLWYIQGLLFVVFGGLLLRKKKRM